MMDNIRDFNPQKQDYILLLGMYRMYPFICLADQACENWTSTFIVCVNDGNFN